MAHPRQRWWLAPLVALMALLIFLPIPFGNVLPALALALLGVGLMFRDGLLMLAGLAVAALALVVMGLLGIATFEIGASLLARWAPG